ncbi:unnamed protein product [Heligmosomoides polygyrus]|uniref:Ras-associating domain-containing protein n=1 Tax=Heligmosomoides polygyrus TaxID=6339 RepID=A0A183FMV7_HELPZ|nr:unnamed protein product [Heligmosomoides polygyrus]
MDKNALMFALDKSRRRGEFSSPRIKAPTDYDDVIESHLMTTRESSDKPQQAIKEHNNRIDREYVTPDAPSQPVSKRREHCKEELLSFYFSADGCLYYDIVPEDETVASEVFCRQLREMVSQIYHLV